MVLWVAIAFVAAWYVLSNLNISLTGNLATIFFFSMIAITLVVGITLFTSGHWSFSNLTNHGGWFPKGGGAVFIAFAVFSLKFIGFEMTPTLAEETNFPMRKMYLIILSALFIPAATYTFIMLAIGGSAPWTEIATMTMAEPELIAKFGLPAVIGTLAIIAGLLHAITTLMGFWTSSARVLYGAAQLNQLPKVFKKTNKYGQPIVSNFAVLCFSIFFCFFTGENWIQYIYSVSCVAAGLVYLVCCVDAYALRKQHPEWVRPYKAPGGTALLIVGMIVSVWIVIGSAFALPIGGYISLAIYFLIGLAIYMGMAVYRSNDIQNRDFIMLTPDDIEGLGLDA